MPSSSPGSASTEVASSESPYKLWIMLPAYNEEEALPDLLKDLALQCQKSFIDYEITVVDDGSADDTALTVIEASKQFKVTLVQHHQNQGLAAAMQTGFSSVIERVGDDDFVLTMDSDGTHPVDLIPQMLDKAQAGSDVVIASRYQKGAKVIGLSKFREFMSYGARICFGLAFPTRGVRDYTCGYRVYRATKLEEVMEKFGDNFITESGFFLHGRHPFEDAKIENSFL